MDPDLTIVLLGKSGVGKSASGNTILGRKVFKSDLCFTSVTKEISEETGQVFGKQISVVDSPGILDSEGIRKNIKTYCQNLLKSNKPCLFLVVLSIGRFTKEDQKAVATAVKVLGCRGLKKSYLLFTNGDKLKGRSLTDFIFAEKEGKLPDVVRMFSGASHLFNNEDGHQEQVQDLLLKTRNLGDHQPLDPAAGLEVQRRMVLLGLPGAGKSSSGNTILGSERFKSDCNFNSVSTECVSESESVDGRLLQVVDTPGLTDEVLNLEQLYEEIMKTLVEASPGPHAFVIVVRIGKISAADQRLFELVPKVFGGDASKYTMVLFTHGDEVRGSSMDELIQSNSCVSDLVSMCDGRYCVFDNTERGRRLQVRELLNKIDEMVAANGGEHCTSDMFRMAETLIREEENRAAQSADSNRPGGARGNPDKNSLWDRIIPYVIGFGLAGGVAGGLGGSIVDNPGIWVLVGSVVGLVVGVVVGVAAVMVGGVTGGLVGGLVGVVAGIVATVLGLGFEGALGVLAEGGVVVGVVVGGVAGGLAGWFQGRRAGRVVREVVSGVVGGVAGVVAAGYISFIFILFSSFGGEVIPFVAAVAIAGLVGLVVGGVVGGVVSGLVLAGEHVVNAVCKRKSNRQSNQSSRVSGDEQLSLRTRSREEGGRRLSEEP